MDGPRNYHVKWSQSDSETPTSYVITYMWNLKQRTKWTSLPNWYWLTGFEKLMVSKWDIWGVGGSSLEVWDGNAIKFGCDDHCTTINTVKFIEYFKKIQIRSGRQKKKKKSIPIMAQHKWILLASMRMQVWSLVLLSGLRIWCCYELSCRSQRWLRSGIAVTVMGPAATAPIWPLA